MRWFGGFSGPTDAPRIPMGSEPMFSSDISSNWIVGEWPRSEFLADITGRRSVAILGPCNVTKGELVRLAAHGVPDDVAWRWPGSYVVAEVTEEGTRLWTDLSGACPIYTVPAHGGVYWSSSSRAVAGLTGAGPDLDWLAASLLAPSVPILLDGRSAFEGIALVPPGHRLTLPKYGPPSCIRVWVPSPRSGHPATRLGEELSAAVAVRLGGHRSNDVSAATLDLSGGCDSTAVAVFAEELRHPTQTVTGVTVHPAGCTTGGDMVYARLAAKHSGITHRLMPLGSEHAPYTTLDAVPVTDEPAPSTIAYARFSGQLQWMRETLGTDCHMTGDGGDGLLNTPPIMLADLIATGRYKRAVVESVRWARLRRLPVWPLLPAAYRAASTPRSLAVQNVPHRLKTAQSDRDGRIGWCNVRPAPPWATTGALQRITDLAESVSVRADAMPGVSRAATVTADVMFTVGRTARADIQLAEHVGVALHNPFTDSRVIDAYLSVPIDDQPGPADYKPVLRDALADLFPPELAARTTKGTFNADHYGGMRGNLPQVQALADGQLAELGLVDPARLQHMLIVTAAGLHLPGSVERTIAAEVWLRTLDGAPRIRWSTAARNI